MKEFWLTKHQREIKLIEKSGLFDEEYYRMHYPEVLPEGHNALEHYVVHGSKLGMRPNAFFDDAYYRSCNPNINDSDVNPLVHYIECGAREGRNPSRLFNTTYYLQRHSDVAQAGINPLLHYLRYGAKEGRETDDSRETALSGSAPALYEELVQLQPLLPTFDSLKYVPLDRGWSNSLAGCGYFKLVKKIKMRFSHLFVLQRLVHGGAATLAMSYARLVKEKRGAEAVLVLLADLPTKSASHLLPDGVQMIALDDVQPGLTEEDKVQILMRLMIQIQPQVVHNVDSSVCWQVFQRYHRQLRPYTALVASLFMFTYNDEGRKAGYASQYLNSCIDNLDIVFTDNYAFGKEAADFYALEECNQRKFVRAYTPIGSQFKAPDIGLYESRRILWSSRIHPDKRPDLVAEIARLMPDYLFEIYGDCALSDSEMTRLRSLKNVKLHGPYRSSGELPFSECGVYLHTTKHEGGAITLKEAAVAGLPAVAPDIGGIRELVNDETGWLVKCVDDPNAYVDAIRNCLSNADERVRRTRNLQQLLKEKHSWESFVEIVTSVPAYHLMALEESVPAPSTEYLRAR